MCDEGVCDEGMCDEAVCLLCFFKWSFSVYGNQNPETTLREKL